MVSIVKLMTPFILLLFLYRTDGQKYYYPNNKLYTVRLVNLSKSDGEISAFTFIADMDTA